MTRSVRGKAYQDFRCRSTIGKGRNHSPFTFLRRHIDTFCILLHSTPYAYSSWNSYIHWIGNNVSLLSQIGRYYEIVQVRAFKIEDIIEIRDTLLPIQCTYECQLEYVGLWVECNKLQNVSIWCLKTNFKMDMTMIRPIPFYDFALFVVVLSFHGWFPPMQAKWLLPALGEPPVKKSGQQIT